MKLNIPKDVVNIVKRLEDKGHQAYIVGGAVRDLLMGKPTYDWDFTTDAIPDEILKIFDKDDAYYTNNFGMVGVPNEKEGERPYEITTFRSEFGYSDSRRPDKVEWGKSLEEDLKRRDFTINALALKVKMHSAKNKNVETELIDLFDGQKDIENKIIRAVGDPHERFGEDALRMMRAVRIAAELDFDIEEETKKAIVKHSGSINKISAERVSDELLKTLASPYPYEGMAILKNVGLMKEILPELERSFGVGQKSPERHHIHDVGTHSMLSLKYVAERNTDPIVRLATLLHDIGKVNTRRVRDDDVVTFYNHEVVGGKMVKKIAKRLRLSKKQSEKLYKLVRYHQFTVSEKQTDSAIRRFIRRVGPELVSDMLDLRVGDRLGGGAAETSWRFEEFKERLIEVQKQPFTVHDLKLTGHDVMKELDIEPGPKVGEILEELFEKVVNKEIPNEKEALLNELSNLKTQMGES